MTKKVYKCNICGNVAELLHEGGGELYCCGQPMDFLEGNNQDEGQEKHLPVIESFFVSSSAEITDGQKKTLEGQRKRIKVKVGRVPHPMEEKHFIVWVELVGKSGNSCKKFLKPGDDPEVDFTVHSDNHEARAYCNIHGLWSARNITEQ